MNLGPHERDALHKLVERHGCPSLSLAACTLIQLGAREMASTLTPGEHLVRNAEDMRLVDARVALDLAKPAHRRFFQTFMRAIAELDAQAETSKQRFDRLVAEKKARN